MKILIQFLGVIEAGPIFSYELAKGLLNNGHEVYAILHEDIENKKEWIACLDSSHVCFVNSLPQRTRMLTTGIGFLRSLFLVKQMFKLVDFDVIICTFPSKYDIWFKKFIRSRISINYCHDPIPHSGVSEKNAQENKKNVTAADKIIVLSDKFVPILEKEYGISKENIIISRHGTMSYAKSNQITKPKYKKNLPINFLFFGRIDQYKGVDVLVEAFYDILKDGLSATLTIAGNGNLRDYFKLDECPEQIHIINRYISESEVDMLFRKDNTVLVVPYKDATQSGVISLAYEYMIPIIASDTGGLREQLVDGKAGILVQPNSSFQLKKVMEKFIMDDQMYKDGVDKTEYFKNYFSWNEIAKEMVESFY